MPEQLTSKELYPLLPTVPREKTLGPLSAAWIFPHESAYQYARPPIRAFGGTHLEFSVRIFLLEYEFHRFLHVDQELARSNRLLVCASSRHPVNNAQVWR